MYFTFSPSQYINHSRNRNVLFSYKAMQTYYSIIYKRGFVLVGERPSPHILFRWLRTRLFFESGGHATRIAKKKSNLYLKISSCTARSFKTSLVQQFFEFMILEAYAILPAVA